MSAWRRAWLARLDASGRYPGWVLFAVLAGMFSTSFPFTILAVSLGQVAEEFASNETTLAWVITAPMLLSAVAFPLVGKLGDLYGHRRVFLWGFAGATVVAALTAFAWDAFSLIALRTLAAVLGSATQPTAMAMLFAANPEGGRVRAMGWWSMTTAGAPALGLILGGPLVDVLGWRFVFLLQAGMSAAALAVAYAVLRETRPLRVRFDVLGALALAVGVGGFMIALGGVRDLGLDSPWIPAALAMGILGLIAFVRIEARVQDPLLPLSMLRDRSFSATLVTNAFNSAAYMGAFVIAPLLLYRSFEFSITQASLLMVLRTASLTVASPFGGTLGERHGERAAACVGGGVMTVALLAIAWAAYDSSLLIFGLGLIGQGVGHGLSQPSITSAVAQSVDESALGVASAANRLAGQGGASFGIAALTIAYAGVAEPGVFALTFALAAALAAVSTITALGIGEPGDSESSFRAQRATRSIEIWKPHPKEIRDRLQAFRALSCGPQQAGFGRLLGYAPTSLFARRIHVRFHTDHRRRVRPDPRHPRRDQSVDRQILCGLSRRDPGPARPGVGRGAGGFHDLAAGCGRAQGRPWEPAVRPFRPRLPRSARCSPRNRGNPWRPPSAR